MSILPSNLLITDVKPRNILITDTHPNNLGVIDTKPNNNLVTNPTVIYTSSVTIPAGQWIPFLGLTYPVAITVLKTRG